MDNDLAGPNYLVSGDATRFDYPNMLSALNETDLQARQAMYGPQAGLAAQLRAEQGQQFDRDTAYERARAEAAPGELANFLGYFTPAAPALSARDAYHSALNHDWLGTGLGMVGTIPLVGMMAKGANEARAVTRLPARAEYPVRAASDFEGKVFHTDPGEGHLAAWESAEKALGDKFGPIVDRDARYDYFGPEFAGQTRPITHGFITNNGRFVDRQEAAQLLKSVDPGFKIPNTRYGDENDILDASDLRNWLRTRSEQSSEKYLYHGTAGENLPSIAKNGLTPNEWGNPLNFHELADSSRYYGDTLLRVAHNDLPSQTSFDPVTARAWTMHSVPPAFLEIETPSGWVKLSDYKFKEPPSENR